MADMHGKIDQLSLCCHLTMLYVDSPGRFFAATIIKIMVAHMLLNYDFKLEEEGVKPPAEWFGVACVANTKASILFRKRAK